MSVGDAYLDAVYRRGPSPEPLHRHWLERRTRNLVLAALPRGFYERVFEPGCSNGELSLRLADRCHELLACDSSERAVELARRRLVRKPNVRLMQAHVPEQWPRGRFDLILFNELGRHLAPGDLQRLIDLARVALADHGTLLACHRRGSGAGRPLSGDQVHEHLRSALGLPRLLYHEEADLLLEAWGRDLTFAQREEA